MSLAEIHPEDFNYELPEELIAKFPLSDRSASKLLYYQQGNITHQKFVELPSLLPDDSLIVFNNTKVIPARLIAYKQTGAKIEILLLEPDEASGSMEQAMASKSSCKWTCMIGNAKKWKIGSEISVEISDVSTKILRISEDVVEIQWENDMTFSELLHEMGKIPLPPYLNREPIFSDESTYQTVYAEVEGAVAAPTAGLHFTDDILKSLKKTYNLCEVTLHVSAGTFQPIKTSALEHPMHREHMIVDIAAIKAFKRSKKIIAVGTTSLRTLESLYWFGVDVISKKEVDFKIEKMTPYGDYDALPSKDESLQAIVDLMEQKNISQIHGHTEIFITPGYQFHMVDGLVTNFHLPGTTLMMLVAAFIGNDWRKVYDQAIGTQYRFLSYGDSSLLMR